jgi:beta-glucosidase-like glycosyl hydrolase/CubicO group peptidase (beta-lactamase class C family)
MMTKRKLFNLYFFFVILLFTVESFSQEADPPFIKFMDHPWVDSVFNTLDTDQRIAQCIWIAAYSNRDVAHEVEISDIIRKYGPGGIVFFQGTAEKQAELTNFYQSISKVPLIISMDAEWGLGMRLQNIEKFPYQMTLGAISNDSLIYKMGHSVADQLKRLGVHVNLAPVADINNNSLNPVINYRSFGENREKVADKALMYMNGMQDNGVLATLKHFPGHGDTNMDSHLDLPVIHHSRERLDSVELFPFMTLINRGAGSVMTAHINLPNLDSTATLPSTLSPLIINDLLIRQMGFRGLVITDAMNMKGVTRYFKPGVAEARALQAGNDVVEFVTDIDAAISEIRNMIKSKKLSGEDMDLKCKKVLALKYWCGLNTKETIQIENITSEISSPDKAALIRDLYAEALTLIRNENEIIPLKNLHDIKVAVLSVDCRISSKFQERILSYMPADTFKVSSADEKQSDEVLKKIVDYDLVLTGIFNTDQRPDMNFGISSGLINFLQKLTAGNRTIITYFGNPYALEKLDALEKTDGLIVAYQDNDHTGDLAAQLIFGGIGARGSLPVSVGKKWHSGFGLITHGNLRVRFGLPENAGLSSVRLYTKIDSIVKVGLEAKAYPGCEVMIARKGIIIFHKAYGFHSYGHSINVRKDDLYDLASVTKVTATLPGLMLLDSEGKFSTDRKLGDYLPEFRNSDKADIQLKDLLTHQAGLRDWIPFWEKTIRPDSSFKKRIFSHDCSYRYPLRVANNLYLNTRYKKRIFEEIRKSPLGEKKYVYSDLAFIIAPGIIENLTGERWYDFVTRNIYHRLGAYDICFNPYRSYPLFRIVPTEYDSLFRKQQIHGTVHDEGAAMLGGISGHAGLFSTANDLMKLMELYRRMGNYGGEQIIRKEIIEEYTRVQFPENNNRRGLGFDKPFLDNRSLGPSEAYPAMSASDKSFGHSGYTGTFVWVDPEYQISYIFFSNRVNPSRNNNLLAEMNIRPYILQAVYDSIEKL